jgi:hypothetical protein
MRTKQNDTKWDTARGSPDLKGGRPAAPGLPKSPRKRRWPRRPAVDVTSTRSGKGFGLHHGREPAPRPWLLSLGLLRAPRSLSLSLALSLPPQRNQP